MQVREDKPLQNSNPLKVHMSWQKSNAKEAKAAAGHPFTHAYSTRLQERAVQAGLQVYPS